MVPARLSAVILRIKTAVMVPEIDAQIASSLMGQRTLIQCGGSVKMRSAIVALLHDYSRHLGGI